jgi:crossover junction endodeoxyribonuclease RuvC
MIFVGIDCGKKGSISGLISNELKVIPIATNGKDYDIGQIVSDVRSLVTNSEVFVVIERGQAFPGQGVVSMFEFGKGYGIILGILSALGIPFQIIHSRVWTKEMLAGAPGEGKDRAISVAKRLFPQWITKFKYELEYADSILLAEYARRKWQGAK